MKHRSRYQTIILSFCFFGITITTAQSTSSDSSYFPLKMGSQWSFAYTLPSSKKETQKVIDTLSFNGQNFFLMYINTVDNLGLYNPYTLRYRLSNDTVYAKGFWVDTTEAPIYNLKANVGDTMDSKPHEHWYGRYTILVNKDETVSTPSGTYSHCYQYKHKGWTEGGKYDTWLAKGIGLVKYNEGYRFNIYTYVLDSSSLITTIIGQKKVNGAATYLLLENYPNPFNPQTTLMYQIEKSTNVSLSIFDLLGREVALLVNEYKESGSYRLLWNAGRFPSGMYYAVLRSNNNSLTRKLILQK